MPYEYRDVPWGSERVDLERKGRKGKGSDAQPPQHF